MTGGLRWLVLGVVGVAAMAGGESASAKGYSNVVFAGANGNRTFMSGTEAQIDSFLSERREVMRPRGGYFRVFFLGPNDFPANSARYFPDVDCLALDWPVPERTCRRIGSRFGLLVLFTAKRGLTQFRQPPTRLIGLRYHGRDVRAVRGSVELALAGPWHRTTSRTRGCYALSTRWRGPDAATSPKRVDVCVDGVIAGGRLYPLKSGAWDWLGTNIGGP